MGFNSFEAVIRENGNKKVFPLWAYRVAALFILYAVFGGLYLTINKFQMDKIGIMLPTPIDDWMAFNRHWVWFYYLYFLVIGFPFLLLKNRRDIARAIAAYSVTAAITLTFYALLRTQIIRPEVIGNDLSAKLVRAMYRWDNPYNCFPSQHVANSFTAAFILLEHKRIWGIVGFVAALLISISTILIKQHWFLDFPGGLTVAIIAYIVVYRWWLRQANEK